jgi:TorA maturation chaperone TorD
MLDAAQDAELLRALAVISEPPGPAQRQIAVALGIHDELDAETHTRLFVLGCHPYESVYLGADGMLGGDGADQIAGFHRAIGLSPPPEPDHLAALFGLYATLVDAELKDPDSSGHSLWQHAREVLLLEHICSWVPVFLDSIRLAGQQIGAKAYLTWADLADETIAAQAACLGAITSLPRALRLAPKLPPLDDRTSFFGALFAPVKSGIALTRADLARAQDDLGVPARAGGRNFMLASMLDQAPGEVLSWLRAEAAAWEQRHLAHVDDFGQIALWWAERATTSCSSLRELAGSLN